MRRWHYVAIFAVLGFAWWAYRDALRRRAAAEEHASQVANANAMVGIVGTVVSYIVG